MTKHEIFNAWAPQSAIWSPWAKPVLFSQMNATAQQTITTPELPPDTTWANDSIHTTTIVVDLPAAHGVAIALSLAALGYRPIPLYNACPEAPNDTALVNVRPIMIALAAAAPSLQSLRLSPNAPPAFLLDANRNTASIAPLPGAFDNRSISLPTDFPSAHLLLSHGIQRAILLQSHHTQPQADLSHTLRRWQESNLPILSKTMDDQDGPQPITVDRPKAFRLLWYNLLAKLGLKSNPLGGFGGRLPMPSSG
jgi:hypothetical protein